MNNSSFARDTALMLQKKFGSTDWSRWQSLRKQFYSYVAYTEAGGAQYTFFGSARGGTQTAQLTNMPKANSFGQQHFLLKAIRCNFYIKTWDLTAWAGTDASTLFSDLISGFANAGVLEFKVNNRIMAQIPKPFLYAANGRGNPQVFTAGVDTITLTEAAPNTLATFRSPAPFATLTSTDVNQYIVEPNVLIEAEQNFECTISYPSGLVPIIGTTITDDSTNPIYIGVEFDGLLFRPVQ